MDLVIRGISSEEVKTVVEIESSCFPPDEAESYEIFENRQREAGELMLGCFDANSLIGYPDDEGASCKQLEYRHREAGELMLGCFVADSLIGFICGTRYHGRTFTHESMSMHIPNGESVCIHSVAVRYAYRRQGVATKLLKHFINKVTYEQRDVARILLICKSHLIPLYTRTGFVLNGPSHIVHGQDQWYELQMNIDNKYCNS